MLEFIAVAVAIQLSVTTVTRLIYPTKQDIVRIELISDDAGKICLPDAEYMELPDEASE